MLAEYLYLHGQIWLSQMAPALNVTYAGMACNCITQPSLSLPESPASIRSSLCHMALRPAFSICTSFAVSASRLSTTALISHRHHLKTLKVYLQLLFATVHTSSDSTCHDLHHDTGSSQPCRRSRVGLHTCHVGGGEVAAQATSCSNGTLHLGWL